MKRDVVLLLGGNIMNYGIIRKYNDRGIYVFVVDWNEHPALTGDKHYQIDVKDAQSIIEALKQDNVIDRVIFAYSSIDLAVPSVAAINSRIGLKTITKEGLSYSSSKSRMTKKWEEVGLLNRESLCFTEYSDEIKELNCKTKIIVKPDNSASSRGITIIERNSPTELLKFAFERAKSEASDGIVVVEEFVEGTEYTVEMVGDSFGNVCVYGISRKTHTKNTDNNRIAVKLHYNSEDIQLQERIANVGIKCYKALHFSCSLGHLEVIVKPDGSISPVEIGARSSGNIASDLVDIVCGESFLDELLRAQRGEAIQTGFHKQTDRCAMYYFYDFPADTFIQKEATILDYCDNAITSRFSDRRFLKIGTHFGRIDSDNARYGYEILEGPKSIMTPKYIERAEHCMMEDILGHGPSI